MTVTADGMLGTYHQVRAQARRLPTPWLKRRERHAREAALMVQPGWADVARLAALRDELKARGAAPPPAHRGLP